MIRTYFLILCTLCSLTAHLYAQGDIILLRINNEDITRSEFETAYRNCVLSVNEKTGMKDFLPRFIDDKLKILEAKTMELDITPEFRMKMREYSEKLRVNSFDDGYSDIAFHDEQQKPHAMKRFSVMQIYKHIPQNCSTIALEETKRLMNRLYQQLAADSQTDFNAFVEEYSDHKGCFDIGWMERPVEFEQTVFSMRKGEISAPFFTPQGLHIVKVLDVKDSLPDDELNKELQLRLRRRYKNGTGIDFLQQLKNTYGYVPNQDGVNELLVLGKTGKELFTLNGRTYTGDDFSCFAEVTPKGVRRQFDDFVVKSLIDCEKERQEKEHPEHERLIKVYKETLLLSEIVRKEVTDRARTDQAGLSAYFSVHRKDYRWAHPRFKGMVLHTRDKSIISGAKKRVKKKPVDEWGKLIIEVYNSGAIQQVQVEQGLYKEGDNAFVDDRIFKKEHAVPPSSHPFTAVIGKKIKGPENYKEAPESLISDYEKFLEARWMKRLHQAYRVEINEEVLKTVNNQLLQ